LLETTFQLQNEVQSTHRSKAQITLFTAFIWNVQNKLYSFAVIADELEDDSVLGYCAM
jgi:hypothetical protein